MSWCILDPMEPIVITEACTENCPSDIAPGDHFINFGALGSNVPDDDVGAALSCIGPQGIDGCGYEAPLETMLQAINEGACWNNPDQESCEKNPEWAETPRGFLRDEAILVISIITDEMDCSVQAPAGYSFFTDIETDSELSNIRSTGPAAGLSEGGASGATTGTREGIGDVGDLLGDAQRAAAPQSVVVGGTLLTGGLGSVPATVAGALLLGLVFNILNFENGRGTISLSAYWQMVIRGAFLLVVILLQTRVSGSKAKTG